MRRSHERDTRPATPSALHRTIMATLSLAAVAAGLLIGAAPAQAAPGAPDSLADTIPVGASPVAVAVSPDGSTVYVTNFNSDTVSVIDVAAGTETRTIPTGANPRGIAVSPDGSTLWVTNYGAGTVSEIDAASGTITRTITIGTYPYAVVVSPDGSTVYASAVGGGLGVIDAVSGTSFSVPTGPGPQGLAVAPDGSTVYVAVSVADAVWPLDTETNTFGPAIPVGDDPSHVAITPDGATMLVTNYASGTVSQIDLDTAILTRTFGLGAPPFDIAVLPDGTRAYVTTPSEGAVSVLDPVGGGVLGTIAVGGANGVGVSPDGSRVYVTNSLENTVSVLMRAPVVPGAPTSLAAVAGDTEVDLTWAAPADDGGSPVTGYLVEYRPVSDGAWSELSATSTTATVPGLVNGTEYEFRVSAVNAVGSGTATPVVTATPAVSRALAETGPEPRGMALFVAFALAVGTTLLILRRARRA